jgi:hypothetical protein
MAKTTTPPRQVECNCGVGKFPKMKTHSFDCPVHEVTECDTCLRHYGRKWVQKYGATDAPTTFLQNRDTGDEDGNV